MHHLLITTLCFTALIYHLFPIGVPVIPVPSRTTGINVQLFSDHFLRSLHVFGTGKGLVLVVDGQARRLHANTRINVLLQRGLVALITQYGYITGHRVMLIPEADNFLEVQITDQRLPFAGTLTIQAVNKQLSLTLNVAHTTYLAGVVSAEMPFLQMEALKAQAVLARTYAYRHLITTQGKNMGDTEATQVFRINPVTFSAAQKAVSETTNEMIFWQNKPIEALFSASNGGYIAANSTLWHSDPLPYFVPRPDPFDNNNAFSEWSVQAEVPTLHAHLSKLYGSTVSSLAWTEKDASGRWKYALVTGKRIPANQVRAQISRFFREGGLRSLRFEMQVEKGFYIAKGRGAGHGVGLSQLGAKRMAEQGKTYQEILSYYFPNTKVTRKSFDSL